MASVEFSWRRYGGYEVSSKGDRRFSAFNAIMSDGRSIEQHYQCDVKGYDPGGTDWRAGKGKPALDPNTALWREYLALWRTWARDHVGLMDELREHVVSAGGILCDRFASGQVNQARALSVLLGDKECGLL